MFWQLLWCFWILLFCASADSSYWTQCYSSLLVQRFIACPNSTIYDTSKWNRMHSSTQDRTHLTNVHVQVILRRLVPMAVPYWIVAGMRLEVIRTGKVAHSNLLTWSIGFALFSVKWVGLFAIALVGIYTVEDLWDKLGDLQMPKQTYIKHWVSRIVCLIVVPMVVYLISFALHFALLYKSGDGDAQMSSLFQANLQGSSLGQNPLGKKMVWYGWVSVRKYSRTQLAFGF